MNITAYIMGISPPRRLAWLRKTIDYMDSQEFPFKKKVVSIDQIRGYTVPDDLLNHLKNNGWEVLVDTHSSRILSMDRAFSVIDTELIFYNEDDVMATLPCYEDIKEVFETKIGARNCGMLSMTLGGTQYDAASGNLGDLAFMEDNTIIANDEYRIFRRLEEFRSEWFFEFPGLFVKTKLFKDCHEKAKGSGSQIERGLTTSYLTSNYESQYYKASVAKTKALSILLEDGRQVNSHCRLLTNLDPDQGNGLAIIGAHDY